MAEVANVLVRSTPIGRHAGVLKSRAKPPIFPDRPRSTERPIPLPLKSQQETYGFH